MDNTAGYGQFCPVAMAAELFCSRWTALVVRELLCGSKRFNDLRRGVPRMSPTLLSKRLKELERAGIVETAIGSHGSAEYLLTPAGEDLRPVVLGLGFWGQRWVDSQLSLRNLDPSLLMWDMRRNLNAGLLPPRRCTIHFQYLDLPPDRRNWWLVVDAGKVDLCSFDPGHELDLMVTASLMCMTSIWMGLTRVRKEIDAGNLHLDGDAAIADAMQQWLGLSIFANGSRAAA